MKKSFIILILMIVVLITPFYTVLASDSVVSFVSESKNLKKGDEFTIDLTISNDSILNGVQIPLSFDSNTFEFQKITLDDSQNYTLFGSSPESIEILSVTGKDVPLVAHITFKVIDSAKGGKYTISANEIKISHLNDNDYERISSAVDININGKSNTILLIIFILVIFIVLLFLISKLSHKKKKK